MIRSLFLKLGATVLACSAIAGTCLTNTAQADVVISQTGIGGRTQLLTRMSAECWHNNLDVVYLTQPWRGLLVTPSYVRYRGVSGEAVYARVLIKQHYSTGWQNQIVTNWQQYKYTSGLIFDSPKWYYFNWQTGVQWEGWDGLSAGYYQAYVEYRWYAGGRLVGTATVAAESSDWVPVDDGFGVSAWIGSTAAGKVGYCALPK